MDEKSRRLWCANEAITIGWGGVKTVSKATGISRNTISEGVKEIEGKKEIVKNRIRKQGAGRKKKTESNPGIREKLESLIEPYTRGEPESPLRWVCKSTRNLEKEIDLLRNKKSSKVSSPLY